MLSIHFAPDHEWWVSRDVFDRLFDRAVEHEQIAASLAEWKLVAFANGGLSFEDDEHEVAQTLVRGLRAAATDELARFADAPLAMADETYRVSLAKLLAATEGIT